MKNLFFAGLTLVAIGFASCGKTGGAGMTQDQINAKVDSVFTAKSKELTTMAATDCTNSLMARAAAKADTLRAAAAAAPVTK